MDFKEKQKKYYMDNQERIKEKNLQYYYDNKEDRQRYNNEYWAVNGHKYKEERKLKRHNRKFKTVDKIIVYFN